MPKLDGTGPEGHGRKTGRGLGRCTSQDHISNSKELGQGMGTRRRSGGGQGKGKRLRSGETHE